jgi:hypothetical protein
MAEKTPAKKTAARLPEHATTLVTRLVDPPAQGGSVTAQCRCGWTRTQVFVRNRQRDDAQQRAQADGDAHVTDPDAAEEIDGG